jgi:hypothetical protein
MRVEFDIDDDLVRRIRHLTGETSVSDALRAALNEYARVEALRHFDGLRGSMHFDPEFLTEREREHPGTIRPEWLNSEQN